MNRTIAICTLISAASLGLIITIVVPSILSDQNSFLANFIPHEFLAIVGVMLTITLASAGQVHLTLNEIEEKHNKVFLTKTRGNVRNAAYMLILLFLLSIILVVPKPYAGAALWAQSLFNSTALFFLLWMTLVMTSLTQLIFAIRPDIKDS